MLLYSAILGHRPFLLSLLPPHDLPSALWPSRHRFPEATESSSLCSFRSAGLSLRGPIVRCLDLRFHLQLAVWPRPKHWGMMF